MSIAIPLPRMVFLEGPIGTYPLFEIPLAPGGRRHFQFVDHVAHQAGGLVAPVRAEQRVVAGLVAVSRTEVGS